MGLSKLLAVGRSVRSLTGQAARYKMTQQNLLPTFGGTKEAAGSTVEEAVPKATPVDPAPTDPAATTAVAEVVRAQSERASAKAEAFLDATKKLRPFGSWFKNPFARDAAPQKEKQPVQAELSLDAVKPVRNELNEPEIELGRPAHRAVSEPAVPKAPTGAPVMPAASTESLWQRLKARLFGGDDKTERP